MAFSKQRDEFDLKNAIENQLLRNQETLQAIEKLRSYMADMRSHAKGICASHGMTIEQFDLYCENPSNFSPQEWELFSEHRKIYLSWSANVQCLSHQIIPKQKDREEKQASSKSFRKQRGFSEKKGWLRG